MSETVIKSRTDAERAGDKTYFTGKACVNGHVAEMWVSRRRCVECSRASSHSWYIRNREKHNQKTRQRYRSNPEKHQAGGRDRYHANRERYRERRLAWRQNNREKYLEAALARRSTPHGGLNDRMSASIRASLRNGKCGRRWETLVGYTVSDLKAHLEKQFIRGMSWKNMGNWHIDHIVPLSSFSFSSADDPAFKAAWSLTNLRPLKAKDNLKKHARREFLI